MGLARGKREVLEGWGDYTHLAVLWVLVQHTVVTLLHFLKSFYFVNWGVK